MSLNPDEARELLEAFAQDEEQQLQQTEQAWLWWQVQDFIRQPHGPHAEAWKTVHAPWQESRKALGGHGDPELKKQLDEILLLVHQDAVDQLEAEGLPEQWLPPTQ